MLYKGSELWKNIEYTNDIERLTNMSKYIDGAVLYHHTVGDNENLKFFKEAQNHWLSKVKIKVRVRKNTKADEKTTNI
jgi:hypothetical protein